MSPSLTAILKECFGGSNPSTTSSRSYMNLMSAALLRIGHIEMKIWVGQWLLFQEEGVENLVCHLVFACFFVPLASFYFGLMPHDQSHLRKIQMLQLPEIHCTNSCLNTNFHSGLLHEEKKRNSCQADTSTHLFFVHLFAHALSPRRYSLHLGFFKDMEISYTEERFLHRGKKASSEDA